jgi:polar amino acid transport system substrate-binding protein
MWQKLSSVILGCSIVFPLVSTQLAEAKNVEEEIKSTGVLKVGIREDSPLFGFGTEKVGYCQDFAENVAQQLSTEYGREIKAELVKSTTQNRWVLVTDGVVHLECGPNTINPSQLQKYNVAFSTPFFVTATQILAKSNKSEDQLKRGKIGIIAGTTNAQEIEKIYPFGQIDDSFRRRSHGIADVQTGEIDGFASDGILLIGTASLMNLPLANYNLFTPLVNERPFCSAYAMILPGDSENQSWRDKINNLIVETDMKNAIWQNWFGELFPYFESLAQVCK